MTKKNSFFGQFYVQVVIYTLVMFGVMYWSGMGASRSLYSMFSLRTDGTILAVADREMALRFYRDVLDLSPLRGEADSVVGVALPNGGQLLFTKRDETLHGATAVVIRVRNRLPKLHDELTHRVGTRPFRHDDTNYVKVLPPGRVSEIVHKQQGDEFVIADPDGNKLIFFQPHRRALYGS